MRVELGWSAPTIGEQFPQLNQHDAAHLQRDQIELLRLKIRGLITHEEHRRAIKRFVKSLSSALAELEEEE